YYASIGDLNSVAINPIRDTVFMGNQGAYDLWGTLNMAVAGLCIPVSQSVNGVVGASKSVIAKTAAIRIGKEVAINVGIDFASSKVTSFAAQQFNLNKTESTLLNLGLSFGLDKSVDSAKSKILGEASFAEGMSYDDAKRYNDYWKQVESGNNTGYPGLTDTDIKLWKFADNKLNQNIALNKVNSNEVVKLRIKALELENSLRVVDNGVSKVDKLKLSSWKYAPDEELYLKYKKVFDNPKYFDQATGDKRWPGQYGDPNIDGFFNGLYEDVMLKPGSKIDRYGGNNGTFFAEEGITIPQRAMAADSDFSTYNIYEIKREIPMRQEEIAPWFDEVGGGIQYQINPEFVKIIRSKLMPGESLIDGLIRLGYLKRL
ncbi:TNT domain-containing protein, partial [Clostridium sartagoforme]